VIVFLGSAVDGKRWLTHRPQAEAFAVTNGSQPQFLEFLDLCQTVPAMQRYTNNNGLSLTVTHRS